MLRSRRCPTRRQQATVVKNGSWWELSPSDAGSGAVPLPNNGTEALAVFDLYIAHGPGRTGGSGGGGAAYEYTVLPGVTSAGDMPALAATGAGLVVNTPGDGSLHAAVEPGRGLLLGAVWAAPTRASGLLHLGGWSLSASRPSLFVLQSFQNGTVVGTASVRPKLASLPAAHVPLAQICWLATHVRFQLSEILLACERSDCARQPIACYTMVLNRAVRCARRPGS